YLQLSNIRQQAPSPKGPSNYCNTVDDYTPDQLLQLPRAKLELFAFKSPEKLLPKLELALGIKSNDADKSPTLSPLLFHQEEQLSDVTTSGGRPNQHLLFELMCRLYNQERPEFLSTFVQMVTIAMPQEKMEGIAKFRNSHYTRALSSLPPVLSAESSIG